MNMKFNTSFQILLLAAILLLVGCAANQAQVEEKAESGNVKLAEADVKEWLGKETKIGLIEFKSAHLHRS
jgi:PBP1b-binding outer membrane lipoprotein LpoB|tara:strand:- start:449 stop:658 length:210 start_codon:yes stop_codon:yes gene_type:complete